MIFLLVALPTQASEPVLLSAAGKFQHLGFNIDLAEDPEGTYKIDNFLNGELNYNWIKNNSRVPNFGYTDSVFWYRVTIHNDTDLQLKRILNIAYPLLDEIEFYYADENNELLKHVITGENLPLESRDLEHRNFIFDLPFPPQSKRTVYLRVATQGSQQLPLELWEEREFLVKDQSLLAVKAIYFGMMGVMILFNSFVYASLRERSYLYYVSFIFFFVSFQAAMSGFTQQFVWQNSPLINQLIVLAGVPATALFAALFSREFLGLKERLPLFNRFLGLMVLANAISIVLAFFLPYSISTKVSVAFVIPESLALLAIGPILWWKGVKEARYYSLAWITLVLGTTLASLNKFGLIPRTLITEHGLIFGSALEALLLSFALTDRFNREREQRYRAQKEMLEEAKARQEVEETLVYQSLHSPITNLPNRVLLIRRLETLIKLNQENEFKFAIVLIHLRRFHEINRTLGHQNADELLIIMGQRLKDQTAICENTLELDGTNDEPEFIANIEGVTFCALFKFKDKNSTKKDIENFYQQIIDPIDYLGMHLDVGVSLGIAYCPEHGKDPASLLRHAHIAVDMAENRENQIALYSKEMNPYSARRLTLMGELRKAIEEDSLELYYQPQIDLKKNSVYGMEALIRWNHPTHGFIPPDEFIPLAESTGLIKNLTRWVANCAIGFAADMHHRGIDLCVSINISALNLQERSFDLTI
ncbi:MAG: EAL domain-containing protein, partial [Pseudomonadales bacterium]|nr:EAL domain-containing protein [Pseudomonadales bacterium]